jgi:arabinofuranosyltransferase
MPLPQKNASYKLGIRILVICGICLFLCLAQHTIVLDDALIYARYVQNALSGHGLVFNAGERVNALTSPLMAYLLTLTSWLFHGRVLLAEMILCTVFFIAACSVAEYMVPYSGMLLASTAYFYSCFGMETTLFLFLLLLSVLLYVRELYFWLPLVCTLTTLTRFEGGLLAVILLWRTWQEKRIPSWKAFVAPVALVAGYLTFNLSYYGRCLPSSTTAKLLHGQSGLWGKWPFTFFHIYPAVYDKFILSFYVVPAAVILSFVAAKRLSGSRLNRSVLPFLGGLLTFYILFNITNYHWYCAPFIFFGIFYAVQAIPKTRLMHIVLIVVIGECTLTGAYTLWKQRSIPDYVQVAQWLNQNSSPEARIAAIETGTIGYGCHRYIDDIAGLTNPKNAVLLAHHDEYSWLEQDKPDYVIVHRYPIFNEIAAIQSPFYVRVKDFGGIYVMRREGSPP